MGASTHDYFYKCIVSPKKYILCCLVHSILKDHPSGSWTETGEGLFSRLDFTINWSACKYGKTIGKCAHSGAKKCFFCIALCIKVWCEESLGPLNANLASNVCEQRCPGRSLLPSCKPAEFLSDGGQLSPCWWISVASLFSYFPKLSVLQGADHLGTLWQCLSPLRPLLCWKDPQVKY